MVHLNGGVQGTNAAELRALDEAYSMAVRQGPSMRQRYYASIHIGGVREHDVSART